MINSRSGSSAPAGYRFPREVIAVAVRWYLRYGLSYRDVEELLAERGIEVDHVTVYRWVQRFTSEFIDSARPIVEPYSLRRTRDGHIVLFVVNDRGLLRTYRVDRITGVRATTQTFTPRYRVEF